MTERINAFRVQLFHVRVPLFHVSNWVDAACKNALRAFKLFRVHTKVLINFADFEQKKLFGIAKSITST